jgi:hypothetical protein
MKWEYTTLKLDPFRRGFLGSSEYEFNEAKLDRMMNNLGNDSWELVSSFSTNKTFDETIEKIYVFKRPIQS